MQDRRDGLAASVLFSRGRGLELSGRPPDDRGVLYPECRSVCFLRVSDPMSSMQHAGIAQAGEAIRDGTVSVVTFSA